MIACVDFWFVKNVCARLFLGYRWWVEIDDSGEESWVFESRTKDMNNAFEKIYFFLIQIAYMAFCGYQIYSCFLELKTSEVRLN